MGGADISKEVAETAYRLGSLIAQRGWVLLNGGRDAGVMAASARGARQAGGTVIGVLPDRDARAACPDLDYAIVTGLGDARNLINVLSSDVVIACPGGAGTLSEVALAAKNAKPLILLNFDPGSALEPYRQTARVFSVSTPEEAVEKAATLLERR
jgi:uncharacterized protein (TIGR00725 family)